MRSSTSVRFGSPVSGSWSPRRRVSSSVRTRSIASASTFATACRKFTASAANARGVALWTPSTPNGFPRPCTITVTPLATSCSRTRLPASKRRSVAKSSTITGSLASIVNPACESAQSAETLMLRTSPSRKPTPAFSRNERSSSVSASTAANSTPSTPATTSIAWSSRPSSGPPSSARSPRAATAACSAARRSRRDSTALRSDRSWITATVPSCLPAASRIGAMRVWPGNSLPSLRRRRDSPWAASSTPSSGRSRTSSRV